MSSSIKSKTTFTFLAVVFVVSAGIAIAFAPDGEKADSICYEEPSWTNPPSGTGTQVQSYVAQVFVVDTGDTLVFTDIPYSEPKSSFKYDAPCYNTHMMRVAGVDANGKQGPWSGWSHKQIFEQKAPGLD